jgi:hypothetical protein
MFGIISERRVRAEQKRLLREVRILLAQRLEAGRRGLNGGGSVAPDDKLGEMLEEVVICGQVLAQVGSLAPNEVDYLSRIRRVLSAEGHGAAISDRNRAA